MSQRPISRSLDLQKLREEGFDIEVRSGHLVEHHVPYVRADRTVAYGDLVSNLELADDRTVKPTNHVAMWTGDPPCNANGTPIQGLVNSSQDQRIDAGLVVRHTFSRKPDGGYIDYFHKMFTYTRILEAQAQLVDSSAAASTFVVRAAEDESVFKYIDTASSRAGIVPISQKLAHGKIAIVGLGGTGSYVLDHVAKTPVEEIHLFDGDTFLQHNAFRSPGAPSADDLGRTLKKVDWFSETYSRMRRKVVPHALDVDQSNVAQLEGMDFVFLCMDKGGSKRDIVDHLIEKRIPFIDCGMGLHVDAESLGGAARVTTVMYPRGAELKARIPFTDGVANEYSQNIQISDLNALNASLAVIKWKKLWGFYNDVEGELATSYMVSANEIVNEVTRDETEAVRS